MEVKALPALPADKEIEKLVEQFSELKQLPKAYSDWFYWTNYSRLKPKVFWDSVIAPILQTYPHLNTSYASSLKRDLYATAPLPAIKPNVALLKLAQGHALDLSKHSPNRISHNSTSGVSFQQRFFNAGIRRCAAENLSLGPFNPVISLMLLFIDEGLPETGHRKNLLNPFYTEMGIGIATTKKDMTVTVQDFACEQSSD